MKTVLITGGTGFIGRHLIKSMKTQGYRIIALVRASSNTKPIDEFVYKFIFSDLNNSEGINIALNEIVKDNLQPQYVIHAAALTRAKTWDQFQKINIDATEILTSSISKLFPNVLKFIFLSSLAASGPQKLGNIIPLSQEKPVTNYGKSKLLAEKIIQKSSINWFIIRPTAVYGPAEKDLFILYKNIYSGISPVIGYHQQELTFIHVEDLVDIIIKSVENPKIHETIFASDSHIYSKKQLSEIIENKSGRKSLRIVIPLWLVKGLAILSEGLNLFKARPAVLSLEKINELKAESWNCDMSKTQKLLNFTPKYNLKQGLENTLEWYENNGMLKKTNK